MHPKAFHFSVERAAANLQLLDRLGDVPIVRFQSVFDDLPLMLIPGHFDISLFGFRKQSQGNTSIQQHPYLSLKFPG
jgi:hypothetical protein